MSKIQVIMCPHDRAPYITNIENTLDNMQRIVGGYIEEVYLNGAVLIINEEGRLYGLPKNPSLPDIVGDCFICCDSDDELIGINEKPEIKYEMYAKCKTRWSEHHA